MTKGQRIGQGRTAEVYAWGDNRILKLFMAWCSAAMVEHELKVAQATYESGLAVPKVEGIVEVDGRRGIVYERIDGPSMLKKLTSRPWTIIRLARWLAELHAEMHTRSIPHLPSQRERLQRRIRNVEALSPATKEATLKALARLPDDSAACHGDFHPDNILMSPRRPIIIDWIDATRGNPLADVARTSLLLQIGVPPGINVPIRLMIESIRSVFHQAYLMRYMQLRSVSREQIAAWRAPIAAARLDEGIREEESRLVATVEAAVI